MKRLFYFAATAIVLAACSKAEDGNGNTNGSNNGNNNEVNKDFIENEGSFTYFGDTYKTVKLEDGTVWMAEPLRYIPEGFKPSSDPEDDAAHIWYPYIIKDGTAVAATSEEDTKKYGYLYDIQAVFGKEVTVDNFKSFEGLRGICPEGWHIPTRAEFIAFCGSSTKAVGESSNISDKNALFYDENYDGAKIGTLNEAGWNMVLGGYRQQNSFTTKGIYSVKPVISDANCTVSGYYGNPALTYIMSSTGYNPHYDSKTEELTKIQYFSLMTTFTKAKYPEGRVSVAYCTSTSGQQVRCVKNKK